MQYLVFALFVAILLGVFGLSFYFAAKRRKALMQWAAAKGLSFSRNKDSAMERRFAAFQCLRQGSHRYAYNIMEGKWSGRPITAFDYHYQTESRDSKGKHQTHHHHFSAVVLHSLVPLKPLFIRPESFFDKITEFFGLEDIDFESAEFSRKFFVKAEDRKWAYDVIHTRTMQFLLDKPQFTIQFDPEQVIAYRSSKFKPAQFEEATEVVRGVLDLLPDYLVKEMKGEG